MGNLGNTSHLSMAEKKALLKKLLSQRGPDRSHSVVSLAQQGLWFQYLLEGPSSRYNLKFALRFSGPILIPALEQALDQVMDRHAVLRAVFFMENDQPRQRLDGTGGLRTSIVDLRALPSSARVALSRTIIEEEGGQPFDLETGPLLRVHFLKIAEREWVLTLTVHHIVFDGWSLDILIHELGSFYEARLQGRPARLAALPIDYVDFALRQRSQLAGEAFHAQLEYWRSQMAGASTELALPLDRPRGEKMRFRAEKVGFYLSTDMANALKEMARRQRATLFMTLLAGFAALLARYSGQDDIVVGSPHANRRRKDLTPLIGFFVDTLMLRADLAGSPTFAELVDRLRQTARGAFAHQDIPFERLVQELQPERKPNRHPLFQVMFILQVKMAQSFALPGVAVEDLEVESGTGTFDLTLSIREEAQGLKSYLEYNAELFDRATAERMVDHYRRLLAEALEAPDRPVLSLSLLSAQDRRLLTFDWSGQSRAYPLNRTVHQLFEQWAVRAPERTALVEGRPDETGARPRIAYGELNRRANRLARWLCRAGVGPESRVGLCLNRGIDAVTAILATLKAGAVYVPLDPAYPAERLRHMAADANASLAIVADSAGAEPLGQTPLIRFDRERADWAAIEDHDLDAPIHPLQLAYLIYSSGSTGKPKGIGVSYGALANAFFAWDEAYRLSEEPRAHLQMAAFSFDVFAGDLIRALAAGGALIFCPREELLQPERLYALMRAEHVDAAEFVPAVARLLTEHLTATGGDLRFMRLLAVGSDLWNVGEFQQLQRLCGPQTRLINSYGVTEATVDSSYFEHSELELARGRGVPIGRPFPNTRMYILDRWLEPAPIGVFGILYLAGPGLARGYHGRPDQTADKFTPDPFAAEPGHRLYRTDDLARRLADGNIDFLGRADNQVKIRGFRVELGEIEATLGQHPWTRQALVLVHADRNGDKRLAAYLVLGPQGKPEAAVFRAALKTKLPGYMIPAAFSFLQAFPLTPNGKVDRRALPAPDFSQHDSAPFIAPRTPAEQRLAEIWIEVLGVTTVGAQDNFFELGGHSLLASQALSRIRAVFRVELPLRDLFQSVDLADLASRLDGAREKARPSGPDLAPIPRQGPPPLSFAQQRLWFLHQLEPEDTSYNIVQALTLRGALDVAALARAVSALIARHETLRARFVRGDDGPVQIIEPPRPDPLPLIDLTGLPPERRARQAETLAQRETQRVFDLKTGPLSRLSAVRLGVGDHRLLANIHHIIADDWSIGILIDETARLYTRLIEAPDSAEADALPPLPVQYADFAQWQRLWLTEDKLRRLGVFWKDRLTGAPDLLDLPTDRPRTAQTRFRAATALFHIPAALARRTADLCRRANVTPFMVHFAVFATLLGRLANQDDVVIGTPTAGRNRSELEGLIGFFVNTLALRVQRDKASAFVDLLEQVRQTTLDAFAHQDLPFDRVVQALKPERSLSHAPIFQNMFILQNAPLGETRAPGLVLEPLELDRADAKFDLTLEVVDRGEDRPATLKYNADLFDAETIQALSVRYLTLLDRLTKKPEASPADVDLLTEGERESWLRRWRNTDQDAPARDWVTAIEAQAARVPRREAVVAEGCPTLDYGQLNRWANRLAWQLRANGFQPGSAAALCIDRSPESVAALLAILKAGGAYVPLDPTSPKARLAAILDDLRPAAVMVQPGLANLLPWPQDAVVLEVPEAAGAAGGQEANPDIPIDGGSTAYIIYTSGSTGRPKGVSITHRAVANLAHALRQTVYADAAAPLRVSLNGPLTFDTSVKQLIQLWFGHSLFITPESARLDAGALQAWLARHAIDVFDGTPSQLKLLLPLWREGAPPPKRVLAGGEALDDESWRTLAALADTVCFNLYGPTECTVDALWAKVRGPRAVIGKPLANTRDYVLDTQLNLTPTGVVGQLFLAGPGVSPGYVGDPRRTAAAFIPNPFADAARPGDRLYRTGDLACLLANGDMAFVGRADFQVKVRGFRIELGEIEAALRAFDGVRDAVAIVRRAPAGGQRLAAFLAADSDPDIAKLTAFLQQRLPDYMIPAAFAVRPALPLTPNGKIDRRRLEDARGLETRRQDTFTPPRSPREEILAGIWREVLGEPRIGVHDSFFDLGGHSLMAAQIVARARQAFSAALPVRALFETPTIAGLAARLDHADGRTLPPIQPREDADKAAPLSFAQQRLWFLDQLEPGSARYNIPGALSLEGSLDAAALETAFQRLRERHQVLDIVFAVHGDEPVQRRAANAVAPRLPLVDLGGLPTTLGEPLLADLISCEARRPFDLRRGPLFRAALFRLASDRHALTATMHHVVSDGWSHGVAIDDLAALYAGLIRREAAKLTPLPIQYADYAVWQRRLLDSPSMQRQLDYWREKLTDLPDRLALPTDKPRPAQLSERGATIDFALTGDLAAGVDRLGRETKTTPFMAMLAVLGVLLARYSRQDDLAVGAPIAGRVDAALEPLIGFFANTLVLRLQPSADLSFRDLLNQVRHTALEAYAHQDTPFERLVETLSPHRGLNNTPLFQVMFAVQNAPAGARRAPGLSLTPRPFTETVAMFDQSWVLAPNGAEWTGSLNYNTELFDAGAMRRKISHFLNLLGAALAEPDAPLQRLDMLDDDERRLLLGDWNDTGRDFGPPLALHRLVEAAAARTPDAPALRFDGDTLDYATLDRRANRLAAALRAHGAGPGARVGVCLDREPATLVALLAALKTGAAYVPLDPAYPPQRLALILNNARPVAVITRQSLIDRLPDGAAALSLETLDGCEAAFSTPPVSPQQLAYLLFTSGSTGRPKGVAIAHAAATRMIQWAGTVFERDELSGVLAATSINFDLSVFELFAPLAHGGSVVLARDALALPELPHRNRVTLINTVPSVIAELLRLKAIPASVRTVNLAGETLPRQTARALYALPHVRKVYNLYGPSEDTTYSTLALVDREGLDAPSIGRPIANTRAYVADPALRLAARGAPGELMLAGAGLARGYLDRPAPTAERFIPDPFGQEPGGRLYRTGDLARWRPDGGLAFLGRTDFQVKLRGFRIELGEIETRLGELSGIREAAVVMREDSRGAPRLVGYAALAEAKGEPATWRKALQRTLPGHMIPEAFVILEALPRTPNGKLDRKALSQAAEYAPEREEQADFTPPRTPEEHTLAEIWADVLGRERVGVHDDFFALGGHSLLATRVVARVRDRFGVELPVRALFEAPTVAELAEPVQSAKSRERPPIRPVDRDRPLPLSFAQQRLWFLDQLEPGSARYHIPTALRLSGSLDILALERARHALAERHQTLRAEFAEADGEPFQVVAPVSFRQLRVVDLGALPIAARENALIQTLARESSRPFNLAQGPLWRASLFRLGAEDHALSATMHHIISDGWSLGVLIREWTAAYAGAARGQSVAREPLAIQYADFALWQRQWLAGDALKRQLDYWRERLAGLPERLELPTDWPRPARLSDRGGVMPLTLDETLTADALAYSRSAGATPFVTLLTALGVLLGRYSRQDDLAIGAPIAGRTEAALEPLIGFFVNTLTLRLQLDQGDDFHSLVLQNTRATLDAHANQDAPFERLVDELNPQRSMSHTPLFQVLFTWQNAPEAALSAPGLDLAEQRFERETAKFDLAVTLGPRDGRIVGTIQYHRQLFGPATIKRMSGHFLNLVRDAIRRPGESWRRLSLMTADERQDTLHRWNQTAREDAEATLHALFERWAAETPHAPAVVFRDRILSYSRLNRWANQIARSLLDWGVEPEDRVAVFLDRSPEMAAAILAVLKAGAVFTPLDVDFPAARLGCILRDAGATAVITDRNLVGRLPEDRPRVLLADRHLASAPVGNPAVALHDDRLAYVIYTSGSTGRPKGVAVSHRAAVNYRHGDFEAMAIEPGASFALVSTPAADLGLTSVLGALTHGGCLHALTREETTDADLFARYMARHAVDALKITPSHLAALQAGGDSGAALPRRLLILGGEPIPAEWALGLARHSPRLQTYNHYGPTETAVAMLIHHITPDQPIAGSSPPLGLPIGNMTAYILEPSGEPAPIGAPGELFIGGAGLARGYWSRPALTAERFTPNSFSKRPGSRLYQTGDLARRLADGSIEFLGRLDFQVKARGFRVEPGEIETVLREQAGVREAVVLLRETAHGRSVLTAYLTGEDGLSHSNLSDALATHLPTHMIPDAYVILDRLPLTSNGKLNRAALPLPDSVRGRSGKSREYQPPRTLHEEIVAAIWADLLGLDRVGVDDHFFEIGGHSLLAIRVAARIRAALGVEAPVHALFETPVLTDLARSLANAQSRAIPPIQPRPRTEDRFFEAPLSFAQQRLWFLDRLEPGSARYHIPGALRLGGCFDAAAFHAAFEAVVERHETLRTIIVEAQGEPRQHIAARSATALPLIDLSGLPANGRETHLSFLVGLSSRLSFNLASGPLLRVALFRLADDDHALALVMHHIVSDGWSLEALVRELTAVYTAQTRGAAAELPPLPVQYADYAAWQRQWLAGEAMQRQLDYWKSQLADLPERLELPTDRPRPAVLSERGAMAGFALDEELSAKLADLGRAAGATPFMTVLAALGLLLSRYSRQDDLAIGSPIAGRAETVLEPLIGFFVNTLVLRLRPLGRLSFRALLDQTRQTALEAYTHQDVPFERLVEELQPQRSLSHTPLFQTMLTVQNTPTAAPAAPGLRIDPLETRNATAKFEQSWTLTPDGEGWSGVLEYNAELFEEATARRMVSHFLNLLRAVLTDPDAPLHRLDMLDDDERGSLLHGWNDTAREFPPRQTLHRLFEAQAARTPQAPALLTDRGSWSYATLDRRARRVAAALGARGVAPETPVGVLMARSPEMIAALLGVLMAGAPYLPLDPDYPEARLRDMLADAGTELAIVHDPTLGHPIVDVVATLDAGSLETEPMAESAHVPPESLAYTLYTSGSTGRPKAVMATHRALANHMAWMQRRFPLADDDVLLFKTPISFDASVWECFAPLLAGARLALAPPGAHRDPAALTAALLRHRATALQATPTLLHVLLTEAGLRERHSLRRLFSGGEALPPELRDQALADLGVPLINLYGPSECTVQLIVDETTAGEPWAAIGRPIDNARAYVCGAHLEPLPEGAVGELLLGGTPVGRGYLNRPALTAERFIPDPFSDEPGGRLYRSGDLARRLADGRLLCEGRLDRQVKLRGLRLELAEVEARLQALPGVRQAAAVVREAGEGQSALAAYAVAKDGSAVDHWRAALAGVLPEAMIPATLTVLDAAPLTPSGKLDRKALSQAPKYAPDREERVGFTPARTPEERALAEIWREVLGQERVGVHDNFFALGGHSLLATRVVARVRDRFGVELPVRALFEAPAIAELAPRVQAAKGRERPPIQPVDRAQPLPLSFAQQRLWFLDRLEPGSARYHIPGALRLTGRLDAAAFHAALETVVGRHETLRTAIVEAQGEPRLHIADCATTLPLIDLSGFPADAREAQLSDLADLAGRRPFDLAHGPLLRAVLFRLAADDHALTLAMHHIIADGWSLEVLVRELTAAYAAQTRGAAADLPPLPIQYADYAAWQRQWLAGDAMQRQLDYWKDQLAGLPDRLELPADQPRPTVLSERGAVVGFALDEGLSARLAEVDQETGATPFMTVLAALGLLLSRYSRQDDLAIGSPIAGRAETALEPLIGFFVNTLVLRLRPNEALSFRALLDQARHIALEAYASQDVPFERLVEELQPQRSLSHTPLFQVMCAVQNAPTAAPTAPGLRIDALDAHAAAAKFEQSWTLAPDGERWSGSLVYNADLFEESAARRMVGHFLNLLRAALADPDTPLHRLDMLDDEERRLLLLDWNDTACPPTDTPMIPTRIAARATRSPDRPAVVEPGGALTYGALLKRADRLAARLARLGAGPETTVAVCLPRSAEMVVALLAAWRAGAAYLPLDPNAPESRLQWILDDAAASCLLTTTTRRELAAANGFKSIFLDEADPGKAALPSPASPHSQSLAYVIYTSGSTGRPKGVAVEHGALTSLVGWHLDAFSLSETDVTTLIANPAFDASVWEIWPSLSAGACLVPVDDAEALDPERLRDRLLAAKVAVAFAPTPVAEPMLAMSWPAECTLRLLLAGGDALRKRPSAGLPFALVNNYGPTECTVVAASGRVADSGQAPPSIGRPIDNTRLYLLDRFGHPAPRGAAGELFIGGMGVARGYLGRAELTAASFTPDPFCGEAGARLYRSGDLARYRLDGRLEFLGRTDAQVKLRGFRIELGEIETRALDHPEVAEAAATIRDGPAGKLLALYTVGLEPDRAESLRAALAERLPGYMVPGLIAPLAELPRTPNSKIDRKALSQSAAFAPKAGDPAGFAPPRSPEELILADVWAKLLDLDRIGVHDNFFALGGHSLLATRVTAHVRERLGVDLPVRALFEAPTIAELSQRLETCGGDARPPIQPTDRNQPQPLSFAQQRLWFLDRLQPGGSQYNISGALRLAGPFDTIAFQAAVDAAAQRHDSLRTVFVEEHDEPSQVIVETESTALPVIDLCGLPPAPRKTALARLTARVSTASFDLARGPLLRVALFRLASREHALAVVMHHIISDGWSLNVLIRELTATYDARIRGATADLPPLPVQYSDFAVWQRQWLAGQAIQRQLDYWKAQLADLPQRLELATDRPRPAVLSVRGAELTFSIGQSESARLAELSHEVGATPFMAFLATLGLLLGRYSRQDDLAIGTPIANRVEAALEPLIGFFVNTLVMRIRLRAEQSFRALLDQIRGVALEAYACQDAPFERLVEVLQPQRSLSQTPLFQTMLTIQNEPLAAPQAPGLKIAPMASETAVAKFEQSWTLAFDGKAWSGSLTYNADLFAESTARRMVRHFHNLLRVALDQPDAPLHRLDMLEEVERRQLLFDWNDTGRQAPLLLAIHRLFEAQAARTPAAPAILHDDGFWRYAELEQCARRIAAALRARGAVAETPVGVLMARAPTTVAALLGVLMAGSPYLPLDPSFPEARLRRMAADAGVDLTLVHGPTRGLTLAGAVAIDVDALANNAPVLAPSDDSPSESLAYVIYTSGSTGRPKGVMATHRALANHMVWMQRRFPLVEDDVLLLKTPLSFDASVWECFAPLLAGAGLALAPPDAHRDPPALIAAIQRFRVTALQATPTLLRALLTEPAFREYRGLRRLYCGGEALPPTQRDQTLAALDIPLINLYGPSECTVQTIVDNTETGEPWTAIGQPIDNAQAYVCDPRLALAPVGAPGELLLGGVPVGRGYLRRPALTAERFIPDLFGSEPGGRLYRTGDLARRLADGRLVFEGRLDRQVKLRGVRMELGEIEARLNDLPGVIEAAAVVHHDDDRQTLTAYVSTESGSIPQDWRAFLAKTLPGAMIPARLIALDALPLTPSGKLDRKSLPAPDQTLKQEYKPPATETEAKVAAVWEEILKATRVSRDANFFELGGHSLLATRVISHLEAAFNVRLPLADLFRDPTVSGLAGMLERAAQTQTAPSAPVIKRVSRTRRRAVRTADGKLARTAAQGPDHD